MADLLHYSFFSFSSNSIFFLLLPFFSVYACFTSFTPNLHHHTYNQEMLKFNYRLTKKNSILLALIMMFFTVTLFSNVDFIIANIANKSTNSNLYSLDTGIQHATGGELHLKPIIPINRIWTPEEWASLSLSIPRLLIVFLYMLLLYFSRYFFYNSLPLRLIRLIFIHIYTYYSHIDFTF